MLLLAQLAIMSVATGAAPAEPPSIEPRHLEMIRRLAVQHEGRWTPLDTVARDVVGRITGTQHWQGRHPVLNLLDWTFRPDACRNEPLIRVGSAEVRRLIGLPLDHDRFSLSFLQDHDGLNKRLTSVMQKHRQRAKLDDLDAKVEHIAERMSLLTDVLRDDVIRPVPDPKDPKGRWTSIPQNAKRKDAPLQIVRHRWGDVRSAFLDGDGSRLDSAAVGLAAALGGLDAAYRPDPKRIELEVRYNTLDPFRRAWILAAVAAGLAILAMVIRRRWIGVGIWLAAACAFVTTSYGLAMRWQLADRIPAANMYESVIFMGWGLCLATMICLVVVRNRLVTFMASLLTAISLMLGDLLPIDKFIRPVAPVLLDTAWMAIHVPVIMVSYSILAIAMGFGLALLGMHAIAPGRKDLISVTDHLHRRFIQVGVVLLTVGIITGSMWGSASWGRYWGWDPKEVWSLIAMIGYVAILHARAAGWLRAFGMALASTAAFWLIVMTYLGVNYVLGIGLHSYAFGKGAVVRWMMVVGGIQLALTVAMGAAYLARRRTLRLA